MTTNQKSGQRLLDHREVQARVLFSDEHIRRLIKAGRFPPPIKMGLGVSARLAWPEDEIDAWIEERKAERFAVADGEAA